MYHKDLEAWKKAMALVKDIYEITDVFPDSEIYGLASQMRRCAVSIPSNLAEGFARFSQNEKLRFLELSLGSLAELETQLLISADLKYIKNLDNIMDKIREVNALYLGLYKYIKTNKTDEKEFNTH